MGLADPATWSCGGHGEFHSLVAPAPGGWRLFGRGPWGTGLTGSRHRQAGKEAVSLGTIAQVACATADIQVWAEGPVRG